MQLMIEWMNDVYYPAMYEDAIEKATELLETEREQIEEAHYEGGYNTNGSAHEAKQYYKETYQ